MPRADVGGGGGAIPAFAVPVAVGDANAIGAAATIVRSDHVHLRSISRVDTFAIAPDVGQGCVDPTLADLAYRCDGVSDQAEVNAAIGVLP